MKIRFSLLMMAIIASAAAFAQSPTDSSQQKDTAQESLTPKQLKKKEDSLAKNLVAVDGKAIVYIIRPGIVAFAISMRVDCDTFQVGWIPAKKYLYTILDSGDHVFKSLSENEYTLKVNFQPGKIYYIEEEPRMGFMYARTKLKLLNDDAGKKELAHTTLSIHNRYPSYPNSKTVEKSPPTD